MNEPLGECRPAGQQLAPKEEMEERTDYWRADDHDARRTEERSIDREN
jgi:hypothetical protein